jgi:8-oxo-dGTP diphosphatase
MQVRVGVAAIIIHENKKILLGLRKGSHGSQTWAAPGGHLEFNEDPIMCAKRESKEETGIEISDVYPGPWTNDIFTAENKHYITLFMIAKYHSGAVQLLEPSKCEKWEWVEWNALPQPLFKPLESLITLGHNIDSLQAYSRPLHNEGKD